MFVCQAHEKMFGYSRLSYSIVNSRSVMFVSLNYRSGSIYDPPSIQPNYLSNQTDVATLIKGIRGCQALAASPPLRSLGAKLHVNPKGSVCGAKFEIDSDGYWECISRHFTYHVYHDVGTCRMGPADDPHGSVVDERYHQ